ncbi:MAG: hemagglutinin protein, partial [Bacteroidota bacterium]
CVSTMNAQSIEREVVASGGSTISNGTTTLDVTIGELTVTTITDGNTTLTQGFQQGVVILNIVLNPIVLLQGAAINPNMGEESLMRDDLRGSLIPTRSPYADMLTCASSVFNDGGTSGTGTVTDNIVDWVWIELRDATDKTSVIAARSALIQRDGNVVDIDGFSAVEITAPAGNYYVSIHHRNHLGIMTATTIALSKTLTTVDFTNATNQITFGSNAQTTFGMPSGKLGMWSGNVNGDAIVQYSGTQPDTPTILSEVFNDAGNFLNFPTFSITNYNRNDVNLDGIIQYSGTNPDTPFILQNVLAHPGNFLNFSTYQIVAQLPTSD